jgi:hypothetical protein
MGRGRGREEGRCERKENRTEERVGGRGWTLEERKGRR